MRDMSLPFVPAVILSAAKDPEDSNSPCSSTLSDQTLYP
jgi:hypothetical protein